MAELYDELKNKIDTTDTEKLTEVQEEMVEEKENGNLTDDEFHRLKEVIDRRLGGFDKL